MSKINILGSLAYDNIIISNKPFNEIIDTTVEHQIQGAFYTNTLKKEFGGCAGNIAYSLKLLGQLSKIYTSVGKNDAELYLKRLNELSLDIEKIEIINDEYTAQAHILNDLHNNQIISFYPGALLNILDVKKVELNINDFYILSPENKVNIINFAELLDRNGISFIFDPGQSLSTFSKEDLLLILPKTKTLILNDYELKSLLKMISNNFKYLVSNIKNIIVTKGKHGVELFSNSNKTLIKAYEITNAIDPTGCGDAFRAGFLYGQLNTLDLVESCKLGNAVASFVVERHGTQSHSFTLKDIQKRLEKLEVIHDN